VKFQAGTLKSYLDATGEIAREHEGSPPQLMTLVDEMDATFHREFFSVDVDVNPFVGVLMMNTYMLLLSGIRQALSGHVVTVFPVVRAALESACYVYLMAKNPERVDVWLRRHANEEDRKACRSTFTVANAVKELQQISPDMAAYVSAHYDAAIDFGAHPNPRSVLGHLESGDVDERYFGITITGVYGRDHWYVNRELLACVEVGLAIAFLFAMSIEGHPLVHERVDDFNAWMARKNQVAEGVNGGPINYPDVLYSSVDQPRR